MIPILAGNEDEVIEDGARDDVQEDGNFEAQKPRPHPSNLFILLEILTKLWTYPQAEQVHSAYYYTSIIYLGDDLFLVKYETCFQSVVSKESKAICEFHHFH